MSTPAKPYPSLLDQICELLPEYSRVEIEAARQSLSVIATRSHTAEEWAGACQEFIEGKFAAEETAQEKRARESESIAAYSLQLCKEQIKRNQQDDRRAEYHQYLYISQIALTRIRLMYEHPLMDYDAVRANRVGAWK